MGLQIASVIYCFLVAAIFLVAAPFWGAEGWSVDGFSLPAQLGERLPVDLPVKLYHHVDDEVVPFAHLTHNAAAMPQATVWSGARGGHQFVDGMGPIARDVLALDRDRGRTTT